MVELKTFLENAIAYKKAGEHQQAHQSALELVAAMEQCGILEEGFLGEHDHPSAEEILKS